MATINEIKEQMSTVKSVGEFTNALQQIATIRMMQVRDRVLKSRPFVEEANNLLKELTSLKNAMDAEDLMRLEAKNSDKSTYQTNKFAVIVITSNQGLTGSYNPEIYRKVEKMIESHKDSDFFVIGKRGQEYFNTGKYGVTHFPYSIPDDFNMDDLSRLVKLFDYYSHITLVYSRFINTAQREVIAISVATPAPETTELDSKQPGKYLYEPDLMALIQTASKKLRAALFQQQIFDARLSQYAAQMLGMKASSDNADRILGDLRLEYNKQRRKLIDKKISEVFAGSALWK